jgi:hypothetical protein
MGGESRLDADDVVLAEIAPGLYLNQLQFELARILQPVRGAECRSIRSHAAQDSTLLPHCQSR